MIGTASAERNSSTYLQRLWSPRRRTNSNAGRNANGTICRDQGRKRSVNKIRGTEPTPGHRMLFSLLFTATLVSLPVSYWRARDRGIWFFEAVAVLVGAPLLFLTRHTFPLTPLLYWLCFLHGQLLLMG